MRTMERQGQSPRALVIHSGDLSEAKRLAGRVARAFPGCAIGLPPASVATMTMPQLSREDRVVISHHVGAFGLRALIGYMRLSGIAVPAVVAGHTDAHGDLRAVSRNLGVPCLPEGFDAPGLREAFRLAYEVRPPESDAPQVGMEPRVPDDAAFAIVSPIGDILDSSNALSQLTGFSRHELLGRPVSALF